MEQFDRRPSGGREAQPRTPLLRPDQFQDLFATAVPQYIPSRDQLQSSLRALFDHLIAEGQVPAPERRGEWCLTDRLLTALLAKPLPATGLDGTIFSTSISGITLKWGNQLLPFNKQFSGTLENFCLLRTLSSTEAGTISTFLGERFAEHLEGWTIVAQELLGTSIKPRPRAGRRAALFELSGRDLTKHQDQIADLFHNPEVFRQSRAAAAIVFLTDRAVFMDGATARATELEYKATVQGRLKYWLELWKSDNDYKGRLLATGNRIVRGDLGVALENALFESTMAAPDEELGPHDRIARSLYQSLGVRVLARRFSHTSDAPVKGTSWPALSADEVKAAAAFFVACRETLLPLVRTIGAIPVIKQQQWPQDDKEFRAILVRRRMSLTEQPSVGEATPGRLHKNELLFDRVELYGLQKDFHITCALKLASVMGGFYYGQLADDIRKAYHALAGCANAKLRASLELKHRDPVGVANGLAAFSYNDFMMNVVEYQLAIRQSRQPRIPSDKLAILDRIFTGRISTPQLDGLGQAALPPPTE